MTELARVAPFEMSMKVWKYDVAGHITEITALLSERRPHELEIVDYDLENRTARTHYWDRTEAWLRGIERYHGGVQIAVPHYWCLPYLSDTVFVRAA